MFKVGDRVKVVESLYEESVGRVGYITRWDPSYDGGMVATNVDFPEHYADGKGGFHLHFVGHNLKPLYDLSDLPLFSWSNK